MDVVVRHADSGRSCVVGVPDGGTVLGMKADALEEMFSAAHEAAGMAACIEGCDEDLDDAECVADTGLEDGGGVKLVRRTPCIKTPASYNTEHGKRVKCIALSRCDTLCSVGYYGGHVTVFDIRTADVVADLTHGHWAVSCTAFSACGTWLATCSRPRTRDSTVYVWLTQTWEHALILEDYGKEICSAAWTHRGHFVSGDYTGKVRVWDLEDKPSVTVLRGHSGPVSAIAASAKAIFSGSHDTTIRVHALGTLTCTDSLCEDMGGVSDLALINDEQHLVSASSKCLRLWCTTTLSCIRSVILSGRPNRMAVSQQGGILAYTDWNQDDSVLLNLATFERLGRVKVRGEGVALSTCGSRIFTPSSLSVTVSAVCDMIAGDIAPEAMRSVPPNPGI